MAYTVPTPADLKAYYTKFAAVPNATVQLYIDRVSGPGGNVDTSWIEGTYAPAIMAAAAHKMARAGVLASDATGGASGVESFKSASASIQFSADAIKQDLAGGWGSTPYGQDYLELLQQKAGPRVVGGGGVACNPGFNGYAGPLPGWW